MMNPIRYPDIVFSDIVFSDIVFSDIVFSDIVYSDIALPFSPLELTDEAIGLDPLKIALARFEQWSIEQFTANTNAKSNMDIEILIHARAKFIDELFHRLWQYHHISEQVTSSFQCNRLALIAVGGYGRGELHPLSDIDILILSDNPLSSHLEQQIAKLIRLLWDLRLDIGHSVRTLTVCLQEAKADITIMTNLLESRLVAGNQTLLNDLQQQILASKIWSSEDFYHAKVKEQYERHEYYHSTSYNLEPDIKNSPGGLRDIQMIQWIALRHFGEISLENIASKGIEQFNVLTTEELEEIKSCRHFLWRIRFALHCVMIRCNDSFEVNRLRFDRQLSIARLLGYQGEHQNTPVEKMMRDYYRVVHNVTELNQMLLQLFKTAILAISSQNKHDDNHNENHNDNSAYDIDNNFQLTDGLIDIKDNQLFMQDPSMILGLFHTLLLNPSIIGISANTIRKLRLARRKLNGLLCKHPKARVYFMSIIKHPDAIKKALLPMHRHGILATYIPGWKRIVGMMQFDLFHVYTVDEHTMRLLLEIAHLSDEDGEKKHPNSSKVYRQLAKPERLIIAALHHDIAKGRSSDHCKLGAKRVEDFCQLHDIDKKESELISFLVRHHLLMSVTAQSRDLQDPAVIQKFAQQVRNKERLQYLLCLTVADVCATNETLWNSWKQSLMRELYFLTERSFDHGIHQMPKQRNIAREHKTLALLALSQEGYDQEQIKHFWRDYRFDYFLRYTTEQIVWHAKSLLTHDLTKPLVFINPQPFHGGSEIGIYCPDRPYLFATVSNELSKRNLNIHDALIITNKKEFALDTFIVLEPNGHLLALDRHQRIINGLQHALKQTHYKHRKIKQPLSKLRHFSVPTQINFLQTLNDRKTHMELISLDKPGLLACVSEVFANLELSLWSAKIATIGERAEDLFVLSNKNKQALDEKSCYQLKQAIIQAIDEMDGY